MKKTILYILFFTIVAWQGIYAQSSGSRLNMTVKKKPATAAESLKYIGVPSNLSYKPLSLKNQTALTNFYRTFLFTNNGPAESAFVLSDSEEKSVEKSKPAVETA